MLTSRTPLQITRLSYSIPLKRFQSTTTLEREQRVNSQPQYPHQLPVRKSANNPFKVHTEVIDNEDREKYDDCQFLTNPLFQHPKWSNEDCELVKFEHRDPFTFGDKVAYNGMVFCRRMFDFFTGYKKVKTPEEAKKGLVGTRYEMTENKWLTRIIFLESVAGIPGSTAGYLRHLHSIRLLKRDKAWIETLLDEAYNERMHLLTFIKIGNPSWFTRCFVYIGQGIFTNVFFFMYLLHPRYCHRFVGYLEEEAVDTYTHLLHELDTDRLKKFDEVKMPKIAYQYWQELTPDSTFKELILRVRADESKHREVNHTLANLDQKMHRNPYALRVKGLNFPQPTNDLKGSRGTGWDQKDLYL